MSAATNTRKPAKRPAKLTAHPAFPLIVALWFGALLGLGSLVLPVALFERASVATGLSQIFPAAAPPLGFTARAAIAIAGTVIGGLLGLFAARQISRAEPAQARKRSANPADLARRAPLSAHAELGEDGFDGPVLSTRRRPLAIEDEARTSDFLAHAPLPGDAPDDDFADYEDLADDADDDALLDLAECEIEEVAPVAPPLAQSVKVFSPPRGMDLAAADPYAEFGASPVPEPFSEAEEALEEEALDGSGDEAFDRQEFVAPPAPQPFMEDAPVAMPEPLPFAPLTNAFDPSNDPADGSELAELVERLGEALERHRQWAAQRAAAAAVPAAAPDVSADIISLTPAAIAPDLAPAAAEDAADATQAFFEAPEPEPAEPETQEAAASQFTPPPPLAFGHFAPLGEADDGLPEFYEEEDDHELSQLAASFALPLATQKPQVHAAPEPKRQVFMPLPDEAAGQDAQAPDSDTPANYGSLLAVKNPFRVSASDFVRVDAPEPEADLAEAAVVFPHEAPERPFDRPAPTLVSNDGASVPAPSSSVSVSEREENERVMREALSKLQRLAPGA